MPGGLARVWLALGALAAGSIYGAHAGGGYVAPAFGVMASLLLLPLRRPVTRVVGIVAVAFSLGCLGASMRAVRPSPLAVLASGVPRCDIVGRILERAGGLGTLASATRASCAHETISDAGVVVIDGEIGGPGATFSASGWLLPLSDDGFGRARARLGADASFDPVEVSVRPPSGGLLAVAAAVRSGLAQATSGLEPRRAALIQGLTIGETSGLDDATLERFRRAGLSHLLAVSGSNVAIVLGAAALATGVLPLRSRVVIGLAVLTLFVLVVGPEPSVLRAGVMGAIGLAALAWGRRAEPLHALGVALLVLIAARPGMVYSVGLHLSATATAGIVLWARPIAARLSRLPRALRLTIGATVAAQIAVAPVLIITFGELAVAGPVSNPLAIPAVAPATVLGLSAGLAGTVAPQLGAPLARLADPFARWILFVGDFFGAQDWTSVEIARPWGWILAAVCAFAALAALRSPRRARGHAT